MRRIPIDNIEPGQRLARTLYYDHGAAMLVAGTALTPRSIARLREFGFGALYVYDEDTEDIVVYDMMDEGQRQRLTRKLQGLYQTIQDETSSLIDLPSLQSDSSRQVREVMQSAAVQRALKRAALPAGFLEDVESVLDSLLHDREICLCVGSLKTTHSYLFDHAIEVAVKSLFMGRRAGFTRQRLLELALGALLHDVGYLFVPQDLLNKKGALSPQESDILKQHAVFGYYLLKEHKQVPLLSAHVAYQHHERQDGRGYPRGLTGSNRIAPRRSGGLSGPNRIHPFAEIVAVPNLYDNLVSPRTGRPALSPSDAVARLREESQRMLNEEAVRFFLAFTPVYPVGTEVLVTEGDAKGFRGVVTYVHPDALDRPVVRLLYDGFRERLSRPLEVDLRKQDLPIKALWG